MGNEFDEIRARQRSNSNRQLTPIVAASVLLVAISVFIMTLVAESQGVTTTDSSASAEEFLKRGEEYADVHDYDRALANYNLAIKLKPDYAEAYNNRGHAYYWKGDSTRAITDFTRAIELRPSYPNAYNNRGAAYMASGSADKAIPDFDYALKLKPGFRNAHVNRANAYLRIGHIGLALDDFHRAGMHPERFVAKVGGVILLVVLTGVAMVYRRKRVRELMSGSIR